MPKRFSKDPGAVLDYTWDWSDWLATGDTIDWALITPASGIVLDSSTNTATTATAWLSGGTAGQAYDVVCKVVTVDGRTDERTIRIVVEER